MPILAPSLLAADFANLQKDIELVNRSAADWFHIDVMDGVFVPNISFGMPVIEAIAKHASKPLDVHLMIVQPERYIAEFANLGAAIISVHQEACPHLHRTLAQIKEAGCKAGLVLNPATPLNVLDDILAECDLVLLMSVNPGFGGQEFIPNTYSKIKKLRQMIEQKGLSTLIEIDGGVSLENTKQLIEAGADVLVAGKAVFGAENPEAVLLTMKGVG